jgi:hypothetical protein
MGDGGNDSQQQMYAEKLNNRLVNHFSGSVLDGSPISRNQGEPQYYTMTKEQVY